jgi:hypothetical protein
MDRQSNLLHIVNALGTASRFACLLDSREQQSNQYRYDRNHDQQLNKRKSSTTHRLTPHRTPHSFDTKNRKKRATCRRATIASLLASLRNYREATQSEKRDEEKCAIAL